MKCLPNNPIDPTLTTLLYLALVFGVAIALGYFNHYVFCDNETNHTGASPYVLFVLFIPASFASLQMIKREGKKWFFPLALALVGILNVIIFDGFNVMKQYDSWISSGMPDRPAWSCVHRCSN